MSKTYNFIKRVSIADILLQ